MSLANFQQGTTLGTSSPGHITIQSPGYSSGQSLMSPVHSAPAVWNTGGAPSMQPAGQQQQQFLVPAQSSVSDDAPLSPMKLPDEVTGTDNTAVHVPQSHQSVSSNTCRSFDIRNLVGSPEDASHSQMSHSIHILPTPPAVPRRDLFPAVPSQPNTHPSSPGAMNQLPPHRLIKNEIPQEINISQPPPLHALPSPVKPPGMILPPASLMSPVDMPSPQQPLPSSMRCSPMQAAPGQFAPSHIYQYERHSGMISPRDQQLHMAAGAVGHQPHLTHHIQRPADVSPMFLPPLPLANRPGQQPAPSNIQNHYAMHQLTSPVNNSAGICTNPYQMASNVGGEHVPGSISHHSSSSTPTALVLSPGNSHPMTLNLAVNPFSQQSLRFNADLLRSDRHMFNKHQRAELEKEFLQSKYITKTERNRLANALGLKRKQVTTWFQNRRARERRRCRRQGMSPKWDPNNNSQGVYPDGGGEDDDDDDDKDDDADDALDMTPCEEQQTLVVTINQPEHGEQDLAGSLMGEFRTHTEDRSDGRSPKSEYSGGQGLNSTMPLMTSILKGDDGIGT